MSIRFSLVALALLTTLGLTACDGGSPSKKTTATAAVAMTPAEVLTQTVASAKGFNVGSLMAAQVVYVYFDTQCSHCGHLWESFKPLHNRVKTVWIPVGILRDASTSQGAALLASADPVKAMSEHEIKLVADHSGMSAPTPSDEQRAVIKTNTQLLQAMGVESVPFMVTKNPTTGEVVTKPGSLSEAQLKVFLNIPG